MTLSTITATRADLDEILALESASWPAGDMMRASRRKFTCRIDLGLVHVARDEAGRVAGFLTAFRPRWADADRIDALLHDCPEDFLSLDPEARWSKIYERYGLPRDWHEATDDGTLGEGAMHGDADVLFGVGITTDPRVRGRGVAQSLLRGALADARATGARYFIGYGRLPMFHRFPHVGLDRYLGATEPRGGRLVPCDLGLRLHWSVGARPVRCARGPSRYLGIPRSMRDDPESRGCGFLVVTPA
jgi:GNAT superfamily N-acetyltransferase